MIMDDDKDIKDLFAGFNPEMSSDRLFMTRLEGRLHSGELLKEQQARMARRSRVAVAVAAVVGFFTGMLFYALLPWLWRMLAGAQLPPESLRVALWIAVGAASVFTAMNAYDLAMARPRSSR